MENFRFVFFFNVSWSLNVEKKRVSPAEPSRKRQWRQIREGNRRVEKPPLCLYVFTDSS